MDQQNKADENPPVAGSAVSGSAIVKQSLHPAATAGGLPVPVSLEHARKPRRWPRVGVVLLVILFAVGGAGFYWWKQYQSQLPAGISWGNGRLVGEEINIDTKFAGRIAELRADLGDMVTAGQVVAVMDTRDIQQALEKSEAQVKVAQRTIEEASANLVQQQTQQTLAAQELDRAQTLLKNG